MNINELIFSKLKLNCLWNKFDSVQYRIDKNINVILISETKIDSYFYIRIFSLNVMKPHADQEKKLNDAVIQLYIRVNIPLMSLIFD